MPQPRQTTLSLKQLQAFVWVSDLASFRGAAERLGTTQPNVSARIAGLETALGVTLMIRDAGSVRLTGRGQELLQHARRVLAETEAMIEAAGASARFEGVLRLGVTEMIVQTWLRGFMQRLRDTFPKTVIELTVDLSVNLEAELVARTIDLALQNGPFAQAMSGSVDLGTYPLIWVASPRLQLHELPEIRLDDLTKYPILTHARNTRSYAEVTGHFANRRDLSPRFVPSSNLAACQQMTLDGMGIATLPEAMVTQELAAGDLVAISYPWAPESLQFHARYDAETAPAVVARAARIAAEQAAEHRNN